MKKLCFIALASALMIVFGCSKQDSLPTEAETVDVQYNDGDISEEPVEGDEIYFEIEEDDDMYGPNNKYCVWEVDSVSGAHCKFKKGDLICYRCDQYGCTADRHPIFVPRHKKFGDGCMTFGHVADAACLKRNNCTARYVGTSN